MVPNSHPSDREYIENTIITDIEPIPSKDVEAFYKDFDYEEILRQTVPVSETQNVVKATLEANPNIPNTYEAWHAYFSERLSVVLHRGTCFIAYIEKSYSLNEYTFVFTKPNEVRKIYSNNPILVGKKSQNPFDAWFESTERKTFSSVDLVYQETVNREVFNLWMGFNFVPCHGYWNLLKRHIFEVICNSDSKVFNYVLDWMADIVQLKPKSKVSIVLLGKKGAGKGIFASNFGKLFGNHYKYISKPEALCARFNAAVKEALFCFADEGVWAGDMESSEGELKALISEDVVNIEKKFAEPINARSYTRYVIASNSSWVVPTSEDERRYLILYVSDHRIGDPLYFLDILNQLENENGYGAMLNELQNRDISQVNIRDVPKTEALNFQTIQSTPFLEFIIGLIQNESLFSIGEKRFEWGDGWVIKTRLKDSYKSFIKDNKKSTVYSDIMFDKNLKEWLNVQSKKTRIAIEPDNKNPQNPAYKFPSIDECKALIDKKLGYPWKWNEMLSDDILEDQE